MDWKRMCRRNSILIKNLFQSQKSDPVAKIKDFLPSVNSNEDNPLNRRGEEKDLLIGLSVSGVYIFFIHNTYSVLTILHYV